MINQGTSWISYFRELPLARVWMTGSVRHDWRQENHWGERCREEQEMKPGRAPAMAVGRKQQWIGEGNIKEKETGRTWKQLRRRGKTDFKYDAQFSGTDHGAKIIIKPRGYGKKIMRVILDKLMGIALTFLLPREAHRAGVGLGHDALLFSWLKSWWTRLRYKILPPQRTTLLYYRGNQKVQRSWDWCLSPGHPLC